MFLRIFAFLLSLFFSCSANRLAIGISKKPGARGPLWAWPGPMGFSPDQAPRGPSSLKGGPGRGLHFRPGPARCAGPNHGLLGPRRSPPKSPPKGPPRSPFRSPLRGPSKSPSIGPPRGPSKSPSIGPPRGPSRGPLKSPPKSPFGVINEIVFLRIFAFLLS